MIEILKKCIKICRPTYAASTHFHFALGLLYAVSLNKFEGVQTIDFLLGFVFSGMLVWSMYSTNSIVDVDTDRLNLDGNKDTAFKKNPLLNGDLAERPAWVFSIALGAIGLLGLLSINIPVFLTGITVLFLSWSYSAPPLRFKATPGPDIVTISLLDAALFMTGFLIVAGGFDVLGPEYWTAAALHYAFTFGLTLPTMTSDIEADKAAGVHTIAVVLGEFRTNFLTVLVIAAALVASVRMILANGIAFNDLVPAFFAVSLILGLFEFAQFRIKNGRFGIEEPSSTLIGRTCHAVAFAALFIAGVSA